MKATIITIFLLLFFSCRKPSDNKKYILYKDSTNYEYKLINPNLIKVIRFFPETKDTAQIWFQNINSGKKDSVEYYYDKKGNKLLITEFQDKLMTKYLIKKYRKNGTLKILVQYINNKPKYKKYYYPSGKLKTFQDLIYVDNNIFINRKINYYENGTINRDSTYYADIKCNKENFIKVGESVECKFNVIMPPGISYKIITGDLDEDFNPIYDPKGLTRIKNDKFILKPDKFGKNTYRFIVIYSYDNNKEKGLSYILLQKDIYVTL